MTCPCIRRNADPTRSLLLFSSSWCSWQFETMVGLSHQRVRMSKCWSLITYLLNTAQIIWYFSTAVDKLIRQHLQVVSGVVVGEALQPVTSVTATAKQVKHLKALFLEICGSKVIRSNTRPVEEVIIYCSNMCFKRGEEKIALVLGNLPFCNSPRLD
jgi:hypothetical protein